ncbi:S-layer homology domain-containing protein [Brevibacillus sp. H7]|uniref:S-layer homology domain-containing protein n=1 Tax=Brevibacillus sp. H7 TaxID=3349138 RepID=UPI0037F74345
MRRLVHFFRRMQSGTAVVLSLLMVVSLLFPMGASVANAATNEGVTGGGITLTGFDPLKGTSANPHINYESRITLNGTYGSGTVGENLRLKIITNNGQTVEDLSSIKPVITSATFSFSFKDINLKPGMNQIAFYETTGSVTKDLLSFYVQYNNTPVLSELEVNGVALLSDPTVIRVPSSNKLVLSFSGKAINADSVKVVNRTTNQTFLDDVSQSGSFSVDVDAQLGFNMFDISAYNSSREVGLKQRSIVVTLTGGTQGAADQFYNVDLTGVSAAPFSLVPLQTPTLVGQAAPPASFTVTGKALFYAPSTIELFRKVDTSDLDPSDGIDTLADPATLILRDTTTGLPVAAGTHIPNFKADLSGDFKQYDISASIPFNSWVDGRTYELEFTYPYVEATTVSGVLTKTDKTASVASYKYSFTYMDPNSARIISVTNQDENKPIVLGTTVNPIRVSPLKLTIDGANIDTFEVYYNDSPTKLNIGTDYTFTPSAPPYTLSLIKLPPGETKVTLVGKDTTAPVSPDAKVDFVIKPEIAPFLALSYVDGTRKFIDNSLQITDIAQVKDLDVQVYNYTWTNDGDITDSDGDKVKLNGIEIAQAAPTPGYHTRVSAGTLTAALQPGSNTLTFEFDNVPDAVFTYTIFYNKDKIPGVENIKLKVEQNKTDIELTKKSTDSAYSTNAFFLSEFSFDVKDATSVEVLKDGKTIASYKYTDTDGNGSLDKWVFQDAVVDKARDDAAKGITDLEDVFNKRNFPNPPASATTKDNSFQATMTSRQYGTELLDELEDLNLNEADLEARLKLFPLTLGKGNDTTYEIVASDGGVVTRQKVTVSQETHSWTVLSPTKLENAPYATVNTNSVPIKIFAENATKVTFGKIEAVAHNTDKPDFEYDEKLGKSIPQSYYVFEANVPLKPGLNTVKFSVIVGNQTYNDEVRIYNVNSSVSGAESRDTFGKKTTFSVFEKALELKFPAGTVLLAPSNNREGNEINIPQTDIFTDVSLYFGIADRTNGRINLEDDGLEDDMQDLLRINSDFNYASPLYYIDAGNAKPGSTDDDRAPGGRDPYFDGEVNGVEMEPFIDRWEDNLVPSKQGTVTIKYDSSIVNAANNILTVFYNNGDEWKNLGGVVNTGKKTITVPFKGFGYYIVMKTRESFSDVIKHPFARDSIETLYAKGIMNEAPGSGFGTELKINRGEFATMIVKALDLPINAGPYRDNNEDDPSEPTFRDVRPSDDDWDYEYKYIETAARAGIIRGKDTGAFYPEDSVTREEASVMIARALNLKLGTPEAAKLALGKMYTDAQLMDHYAAASVLAVSKAKIMNGEVNDPTAKKPTYRFNPKGDLTRAEMAVITLRIMVQLKKLPKQ